MNDLKDLAATLVDTQDEVDFQAAIEYLKSNSISPEAYDNILSDKDRIDTPLYWLVATLDAFLHDGYNRNGESLNDSLDSLDHFLRYGN